MLSDAAMWYGAVVEVISATAAHPWVIALGLAGLTLLVEDAAIAAGILLATEGLIGQPLALVAVAGGIAGGDMLLYLLGVVARRTQFVRRYIVDSRTTHKARQLLDGNLTQAVLIARVVPGLRLAVYTASGLLAIPFLPFAVLVVTAVGIWTGILFWLGTAVGVALTRHWDLSPWLLVAVLFVLLAVSSLLARRVVAAIQRFRP